ncbi:MAG TPA: hypothetical protein VG963_24895 [Polyangiaceae bacterium]|nr:hypothetical protein [Polyangiaceae bacterium]
MKRWLLLLGLIGMSAIIPGRAWATEVGRGRDFGLGFAFGSPTSIVGKYFVGDDNALDFGLGFWRYGWNCNVPDDPSFCHDYHAFSRISLNADYLWQDGIVAGRAANLDWHIGAGGRVWLGGGDFALAARMPIGLDLTFRKPSFLEVFLELAPALYIVPGIDLDIEAFLGVRFYF